MRFHFYSPRGLEPWDWRNPDATGIGNSETSHIEMALRLAKRGHEVISYTQLPGSLVRPVDMHGGVEWRDLSEAGFDASGVWALYRCPEMIERFTHASRPDQQVWLIVQDTYFHFTDAQAAMVDTVLVLCEAQRKAQAKVSPNVADKLVVTSNGIRVDMIEDVERSPTVRCPHRLHFSSSPDRGLGTLLRHIFPRVREYVPDAELHVYYGLDNIEKLKAMGDEAERTRAEKFFAPAIEAAALAQQTPSVVWHGRIGQRDLTSEWLKAGVWAYPNTYPESSCATCMEAQAIGAFPVVHPLWGVAENTQWGSHIQSHDPHGDPLTHARYVAEIVGYMQNAEALEPYRRQMMADARTRFSWDNFVTQWEALALVHEQVAA